MFFNDRNKSYQNHWYKWAFDGADREALFYDVRQLVEDMIREICPQIIKEYVDTITIDVETRLNGKRMDLSGLREDIVETICNELEKIS